MLDQQLKGLHSFKYILQKSATFLNHFLISQLNNVAKCICTQQNDCLF